MSELTDLTRRVVAATAARELAWLEAVLAPEFTLTTGRPGAEVRTRDEWLAITAGRYVVEAADVAGLEEAALGEGGAVVRYRLTQRAAFDGADRSGAFRVTDCWARRDGAWRLVARHATAVPGAGGEALRVRPERLALQRADGPPAPLHAEIVRDAERTTIAAAPDGAWRALEVEGPLDLALTGVMARLSAVLAAAGVPLFAVSTYDTDVLLVRDAHLQPAVAALRASGHPVPR